MKTLIIIPSRLSATRLPGKPLLKINGLSIISHVFKKAEEANIGEVIVATGDQEIIDDVKKNGGQAILTNNQNQNIVKVTTNESLNNSNFPEANDFLRKISNPRKNIYHHLGIYCYKKEILKNFISFTQSSNEVKHKLEQLRALDNNIKINVALAKSSPIGVDTEEDLMAIKKIMEYK